MIRFAYNPTTQPVDLDPEGRQLPGRDWGPADDATEQVQAAVARGALVWAPEPPAAGGHPGAVAGWVRYQAAINDEEVA